MDKVLSLTISIWHIERYRHEGNQTVEQFCIEYNKTKKNLLNRSKESLLLLTNGFVVIGNAFLRFMAWWVIFGVVA